MFYSIGSKSCTVCNKTEERLLGDLCFTTTVLRCRGAAPAKTNPGDRDSFDGGGADGGERFLSAFCMTVRCRWPSGKRHRTVMQMLRSFGVP